MASRGKDFVAGWRLWVDVILADGADGFVVSTDLATAFIFGMKGVAKYQPENATRAKNPPPRVERACSLKLMLLFSSP